MDAALVLTGILVALASVSVWFERDLPALVDAQAIDLSINVTATIVGLAVAILAFVRWRETSQPAGLYVSAAFVTLTLVNALTLVPALLGREIEFGLWQGAPTAGPAYLWAAGRLIAALLLVAGAIRALQGTSPRIVPLAVPLIPIVIVVALAAVLLDDDVPVPPMADLRTVASIPAGGQVHPVAAVAGGGQVVVFMLFAVAALLFRQLYRRDGDVSHAFLAVGLVVAAFSQLHFAVAPVVAWGIVTSADTLRMAFHAVLFLGIQAQLQADLRQLRRANGELRRLGEVEAASAMLAERGRLAREIHDGLAQHLWFAKLNQGRLAQEEGLSAEGQVAAREVLNAIDAALAEARQAVMALRTAPGGASTLAEVLRSYVDDFADRFGFRAEFETDEQVRGLPPRIEAEVLRIVQEALNNVRKHADATLVRVRLEVEDGVAQVRVIDNGRGFDPVSVPRDRYGLSGMRERAELIGARLDIRSAPHDGSEIVVSVPLPPQRAESGA